VKIESIQAHKDTYKALAPCFCNAIEQTIHFNAEGLKHILYKQHRPRSKKEQAYRLSLIPHLQHAITTAKTATRKSHTDPRCTLWILEWIEVEDNLKIKIVLRKIGNGNVHFLSVMGKKFGKRSDHRATKKSH